MDHRQHKQDDQPIPEKSDATLREERNFLHYVALFYGIGLLFVLVASVVSRVADTLLLLVFSGILVAVLLYDISVRVHRWLHLSRGLSLGLVVVLLLVLLAVGGWSMAPQIMQQAGDLATAIPNALERLRTTLERVEFLRSVAANLPSPDQLVSRVSAMLPHEGFFSGVLGMIGNILIIAFVGIYFAAQPYIYIEGIVTLVPHRKRQRAREVIAELGRTLGQWLVGKFVSMVIVGIATAIGLGLLGVPLALVLGILAGLLDFIPYLGPIMAGIPAVLIAFSESPTLALHVTFLILGVQVIEAYLLLPLIERRSVSLPPALTIVMQVVLGALFGLAGIALATPVTAVLVVLVAMLYVQDVLDDPVKTPSQHR